MYPLEHVIIAAAGRGKRLGMGMPKCLIPINGIPIINYQLQLFKDARSIRIIVGYCEDAVVKHVRKLKKDIIFVRNPSFKHTTTLQSLSLASRGIKANCLCVDGDMIIDEHSFKQFVQNCTNGQPCIAISDTITENPVYAVASKQEQESTYTITRFSRKQKTPFEWANMAYIPASWLSFDHKNFYEKLESFLPITATCISRIEIDTHTDLAVAESEINKITFNSPIPNP